MTTHVTIKFASFFRSRVGQSLTAFSFEGDTLSQLLDALVTQYDISDLLLNEGEIRQYVRVVINGRFSYLVGGLEAHIPQDAMIVLLHSYVVAF